MLEPKLLDKLSKGVMPVAFRMHLTASDLAMYLEELGLTEFKPARKQLGK